MFKAEGLKGFYKGIDSALVRQATYTTARFGIFLNLMDYFKAKKEKGQSITLSERAFCSVAAGGLGSIFGNPADLALIRMQTDKTLPEDQRRNYKHVFDAFSRIVREEGVLSLWRGCTPTIVRAMALNLGMLAPFDYCKEKFSGSLDPYAAKIAAAAVSGFLASFMSLPFDYMKTRLQKMKPNAEGIYPYAGLIDAFRKTIAVDGVVGLWAGFPTYLVRIAPHAILTLLMADYLRAKLL